MILLSIKSSAEKLQNENFYHVVHLQNHVSMKGSNASESFIEMSITVAKDISVNLQIFFIYFCAYLISFNHYSDY